MTKTVFMGTGHYIPERVVTNEELTRWMETSDQWIVERTGIHERRWVSEGMSGAEMAEHAAKEAAKKAGISLEEIDCIVLATLSPDHTFPGTGCFLQDRLGLPGIPALDVRAQCSGFIYGLSVADAWIRSGQYKRVLMVGTEVHSTGMDVSTRGRDVACLFGDGAGAVILGASKDDRGILSIKLHADGKYAKSLWIEAPGSRLHPRIDEELIREGRHYPKMNGRHVFTFALQKMPEVIHEVLEESGHSLSDVDLIIPHQANKRITEQVAKQLGVGQDLMFSNIEKLGNTTAASIPLAIYDAQRQGRLKPGDLVVLASFGAGFTWAAALVRW